MITDIEMLIGQTLCNIDVSQGEECDDYILFETVDGRKFKMYHEQDCCESVDIEDICGDMNDLIGTPIVRAFEQTSDEDDFFEIRCFRKDAVIRLLGQEPDYEEDESHTWTFYAIGTIKGTVTIRWYGASNGYYSERAHIKEI